MNHATKYILASIMPLIGGVAPAVGQLAPSDDDEPAATVRLIAQTDSIAPGAKAWIGVEFEIAPEWHIYWPGQNDAGYAPTVEWDLPDGVTIGQIRWPKPHRHVLPGDILDHIYEGRTVLVALLTASPGLESDEPLTLRAYVEWLECEEGCVPRGAAVSLTLPVTSAAPKRSPEAPILEASLAQIPGAGGTDVRIEWRGIDRVTLTPNVRAARVAFYPSEAGVRVDDPLRNGEARGASITLPLRADGGATAMLQGILEAWDSAGVSLGAWVIDDPLPGTIPSDNN